MVEPDMKQQPLCDDKPALIAYLYGECDQGERRLVEQHLASCATCAAELDQLRGVRDALREWAPPDQALGFRVVRDGEAAVSVDRGPQADGRRRVARWFPRLASAPVPVWAQLAAAVLVLAAGAAIANLDISIGSGGVSIRTGWQNAPAAQQAHAPTPDATAPWRADLVALERQLRQEISAIPVSTMPPPLAGAAPTLVAAQPPAGRLSPGDRTALVRQVQPLLDDIARRQQREFDRQLAERFIRFARDADVQRAADLRMIQQGLGQMDVRTTSEVAQLRQAFMRVANVQQMK
jgi:anti-sigma factor RsiW